MSHVTVPGSGLGVNVNARKCHVRTPHDGSPQSCALHWPSPCTPHALQRLGRRNAVCETDFIPSVAPSHVLRRRKPMLVRDDRGVAQHGHGVRTRTWKQWHRLLERLRNGATATPCAAVRWFQLKERTLADCENQPQVGLARSEIDKESLMHNIMHAHGLRSRKGCAWPCLEAPAFREQKVS